MPKAKAKAKVVAQPKAKVVAEPKAKGVAAKAKFTARSMGRGKGKTSSGSVSEMIRSGAVPQGEPCHGIRYAL